MIVVEITEISHDEHSHTENPKQERSTSKHHQDMMTVLSYIIERVQHFKEFEDKKEYEKMMYEHRIKELYAEYMKGN